MIDFMGAWQGNAAAGQHDARDLLEAQVQPSIHVKTLKELQTAA